MQLGCSCADEKSLLECAGLNRLEAEDERALRERSSDPLGLESCAATVRDPAKRRQRIGGVGIQLRHVQKKKEKADVFSGINEDKSRAIDLTKGGSFAFLGFEYRLVLGRNQKWRPQFVPKMKKRTALFAKLREVFRQHVSQPVGEVIE